MVICEHKCRICKEWTYASGHEYDTKGKCQVINDLVHKVHMNSYQNANIHYFNPLGLFKLLTVYPKCAMICVHGFVLDFIVVSLWVTDGLVLYI